MMTQDRCRISRLMATLLFILLSPAGLASENPQGVVDLPGVEDLPVFDFLGVPDRNGIHFREGGHAQNDEDWRALLNFADKQFFGMQGARKFDVLPFPDAKKAFAWTTLAKKE